MRRCGDIIMNRIRQSGRTDLYAKAYHDTDRTESDTADPQSVLLALNLMIIVLSSFIVGSAYKSHLRRFTRDIGVLRFCGADNRQIYMVFLVEFAAVFTLSAISALLISCVVMKLLFTAYLEVTADGFVWLVFRLEPLNTALHIAAFFVILLLVLTVTLFRTFRQSAARMAGSDVQSAEMRRKPRKLRIKASPERSLLSLWLRRTNRAHRSCLAVAIPVMTLFLFLFAYLSLDAEWISSAGEYDFSLIKRNSYEGFSQEDIEYVRELAPVMEIRCRRTVADEGGDPYANEVYGIDIRLISPGQNREAEALLLERFSGAGYEIRNFAAQAEQGRQMSKGIFLMLTFIFSAMFLFTLVIISMKLGDYIGDSSGTIKTLSSIGAPRGMIKGSYVRQSAISAGFAALLPAAGSILLFIPATASATQKLTVTPALILVYLAVMAVTAAAFILPVSHAVNQLFKRREQVL